MPVPWTMGPVGRCSGRTAPTPRMSARPRTDQRRPRPLVGRPGLRLARQRQIRVAAFQEPCTGAGHAGQPESIAIPTVRHDSNSFVLSGYSCCKARYAVVVTAKTGRAPLRRRPTWGFLGVRHWGIRGRVAPPRPTAIWCRRCGPRRLRGRAGCSRARRAGGRWRRYRSARRDAPSAWLQCLRGRLAGRRT